jgi:hypothetical protein
MCVEYRIRGFVWEKKKKVIVDEKQKKEEKIDLLCFVCFLRGKKKERYYI